jgi:hypothetical protein
VACAAVAARVAATGDTGAAVRDAIEMTFEMSFARVAGARRVREVTVLLLLGLRGEPPVGGRAALPNCIPQRQGAMESSRRATRNYRVI